jgi:hypothetical protein
MHEARISTNTGGTLRRLRRAATIAFCLHLVAGAAMALILRNGLETNPDFLNRVSFIVDHAALWTFAWLTWTAAAVAILYFYAAFAVEHQTGPIAVWLTIAAIGPDLCAQAIEIGALPQIATRADLFVTLHRIAVLMSGFVANGLYSASAFILAWTARRVYPAWIPAAGLATGIFGIALSAAALSNSADAMFWANVALLPCLLLWLGGVAIVKPRDHR